jgi:hypothetical protein
LDGKLLLFEQNNKRRSRASTKATVVATARILSYEDIVEAQKKRDIKETKTKVGQCRRSKAQAEELEGAEDEITNLGLEDYCSVMRF